ncbi:hypothetical protein NEF87_000521 [Candidatus Lokiarchaeum ossiferum]|uniref:SnoaL-like domain-containing protein n=1 Tax=Candidatus Lokiarchaeum ossiferum TaxID=2951803 RepID=A0ABY6HNX9_9ARCH|nr:hypothetical protein NEF87_000521 [Candidatus Lokiarchaeum sp. B-35]
MDEELNVLIVKEFNNAINRRDIRKLASLMAEDHQFIDSENEIHKGKGSMVASWKEFFHLYPNYKNHFVKFYTEKNKVIIEGYSTCSHKVLDGPAIWTAIIVDQKIQEWRVYLDNSETREKLKIYST